MLVGIIDYDLFTSEKSFTPNPDVMLISAYHKKRGDIAKYRKGLLRDFKCKIVDYQRSVQDDDHFLVFCSNIVERADMSTEERVWVFGEMEGVR